jgi:hypothetical protein
MVVQNVWIVTATYSLCHNEMVFFKHRSKLCLETFNIFLVYI